MQLTLFFFISFILSHRALSSSLSSSHQFSQALISLISQALISLIKLSLSSPSPHRRRPSRPCHRRWPMPSQPTPSPSVKLSSLSSSSHLSHLPTHAVVVPAHAAQSSPLRRSTPPPSPPTRPMPSLYSLCCDWVCLFFFFF